MAPVRISTGPGFLQEQDFPERVISSQLVFHRANCSSVVLELRWSSPLQPASYAGAVLSKLQLRWSSPHQTTSYAGASSEEKMLWRGALEEHWSILFPGKSCSWNTPGLNRTRLIPIFKNFIVKTKLTLKI
jgi:hypothetical protein